MSQEWNLYRRLPEVVKARQLSQPETIDVTLEMGLDHRQSVEAPAGSWVLDLGYGLVVMSDTDYRHNYSPEALPEDQGRVTAADDYQRVQAAFEGARMSVPPAPRPGSMGPERQP